MNKQNFDAQESEVEKKSQKREKKKKKNMKVSGGNVHKLQKIIKNKNCE